LVPLPLVQLWDKRSLILHFAILNIKIRFKNTYLGVAWAAIEPLLTFIVLFVVFTNIRGQDESFAIYLISGIMLYHIFLRGTTGGLASLTNNSGILKSLNTKREFFPVVATAAIGILALVDVAVFFALMPVFQFTPAWTLVLLPIPIFLVLILVLGMSYLLSIATVFVRDIQHIWTIFVSTLLFVSPIFWYLENVDGVLSVIQKINPLGQLIELVHGLVIYKQIPILSDWIYTTIFVIAIFFIGFFVFHKYEGRITEEL